MVLWINCSDAGLIDMVFRWLSCDQFVSFMHWGLGTMN